jgi:hypothetical protein
MEINMNKKLLHKENEAEIGLIDAEMYLNSQK